MSVTSTSKNDNKNPKDRFNSSVKGGFSIQHHPITRGHREKTWHDHGERGNCKMRTDFVGLFRNSGGAQGPKLRCRNNSQAQSPALQHAPSTTWSNMSWTTELQFPVEIVEEGQLRSDTSSCDNRTGDHGQNTAASAVASKPSTAQQISRTNTNDTGCFPRTATKTSFDCILSDDSAEALDFFEAAANSGINFPKNVGNDPATVRDTKARPASPPFKRQRHFSLEDYNDLMDEFSSENSNSNSSFNGTKPAVAIESMGKIPNFMQVDDCSRFSLTGSETPSTPSTPNAVGLGLANAFTFPAATNVAFAQDQQARIGFFNLARQGGCGVMETETMDFVSLDTDPEHISAQLLCELKQKLVAAVEEKFRLSLQFPSNLLHEIAAHVIQEASPEPCGLKGCLIFIYFEGENDCQYVNTLRCDPGTIPTFELTLTLRQGQNRKHGWISTLVKRNFALEPNLLMSTSYRLVKRRRYRLNEVEELTLQ